MQSDPPLCFIRKDKKDFFLMMCPLGSPFYRQAWLAKIRNIRNCTLDNYLIRNHVTEISNKCFNRLPSVENIHTSCE